MISLKRTLPDYLQIPDLTFPSKICDELFYHIQFGLVHRDGCTWDGLAEQVDDFLWFARSGKGNELRNEGFEVVSVEDFFAIDTVDVRMGGGQICKALIPKVLT